MKVLIPISLALLSKVYAHTADATHSNHDLQGGIFTLTDAETGLNWAIESDSFDDNAALILAAPSESNSQKFQIVRASFGNYLIANLKSNKYLRYDDAGVLQGNLTYTTDQQWVVKMNSQGNFVFEPHLLSKVYLGSPENEGEKIVYTYKNIPTGFTAAPTTLNEADEARIAKATLEATTYPAEESLLSGTYRIVLAGTNRAIEVSADGKNIIIGEENAANKKQEFKIDFDDEGHYTIINVESEQPITAVGNRFDGGVEFVQTPLKAKEEKQFFNIIAKGENVYTIKNKHNHEMITAPENNGENVVQQYFVGAPTQLYEFKSVN